MGNDCEGFRRIAGKIPVYLKTGAPVPEVESLRARVRELEGENARLRAALQALYDEQSGPPLLENSEAWFDAMEKAQKALGEGE